MRSIEYYQEKFNAHLSSRVTEKEPLTLYKPMSYILALGGKRLRPVLTLLSTDLFGGNYKDAFNAAMAVEYFHNFSLIHDDIMERLLCAVVRLRYIRNGTSIRGSSPGMPC